MTLRLEINGTDFTAKWRPYESHWSERAYMGEASGESEFVIDDDERHHRPRRLRDLQGRRSGRTPAARTSACSEGASPPSARARPEARRPRHALAVTAADANYELRGIRINDSNRPVETDRERVLAIRAAYLDGVGSTNPHARDTTDMDGTFVEAADLIDLPAETYTDTFPDEVFRPIAEMAAKTFFVFIDGDLEQPLLRRPR